MLSDDDRALTVPDVSGYTIFCDDIRLENTNKWIAIGIYNAGMQVYTNFPIQVKSFAMLIQYFERIGTQTEPVTIQVFFPGIEEPAVNIQVPVETVRMPRPNPDPEFKSRFYAATFPIIMGPVTFPTKGAIKVIAIVGEKQFRLGSLWIAGAPPPPQVQAAPETKEAAN